jgi:hypothetical protein
MGAIQAIIVVYDGFDMSLSNAYQTTRYGYYHGFEQVGVQPSFVQHKDIASLPSDNYIFWLTCDDYNYLNNRALNIIRESRHFVQVNCWFDGMKILHLQYKAPSPDVSEKALRGITYTEPSFVWGTVPESYLWAYQGWAERGFKVVSLPWACDTARYYPVLGRPPFINVEVAFVGGYRPYKESQYQDYLYPFDYQVWGYSEWPDKYNGVLPYDAERLLYHNARVSPTISEPQFTITGDTVERPFKVMGSGGLTVFDCVPAYRELFTSGESLIPDSVEMYQHMVRIMLEDDDLNHHYREVGYKAIMERHTYKHRCEKVLREL